MLKVNIQFPDCGSENQSLIAIIGYEESARAAEQDILAIVEERVSSHFCILTLMGVNSTKTPPTSAK